MSAEDHIQLWNNFRAGSPEAFSAMYKLFAPDLYRYGYNIVRDKPLIEDALQELFLHLYNRKEKLGPTDNIRYYLYRAFRNRVLDLMEKSRKYNAEEIHDNHTQFMIEPYEQGWMEEEFTTWQNTLILKELNNLPRRQREVLYLIYMKGMSYQEAADIMKINPKTVLNGVQVALKTLQKFVIPVLKRNGVIPVITLFCYRVMQLFQ